MITITDDISRVVTIPQPAQRIVCLVPSITETLFTLGAGDRVVGITDYCIHPVNEVKARPRVGGTKNFSEARVLELMPDLVIANAEENRRHQIEKLERAGLKVFVTFPKSIDGCAKMIADVAALAGTEATAGPILAAIERARSDARACAPDPPCPILCPIWKNPYMTVNRNTYVDSVIRGSGGVNIFEHLPERYPQFQLKDAMSRMPEAILLPTEPYHFTEADISDFLDAGRATPAVRNGRIHIIEGELLTWYGPRLPRALGEISAILRSVEL